MSTTPSPSKRPRGPSTSVFLPGRSTPILPGSEAASATGSPFQHPGSHLYAGTGGRPTPPPGMATGGMPSTAVFPGGGIGMSPADAFSPSNPAAAGFTPYATSPAYAAMANGQPPTAASPMTTALFHGSKILSNIQVPSPIPGHNAHFSPQHNMAGNYYPPAYGAEGVGGSRMLFQGPMAQGLRQGLHPPQPPAPPQLGSPEYLRLSLQHLQQTLLTRLESEADAYFDSVDAALAPTSDSRTVVQKANNFSTALEDVLSYLEKNGLAALPAVEPEADTATSSSSTERIKGKDPAAGTESLPGNGAAPTTDAAADKDALPPTAAATSKPQDPESLKLQLKQDTEALQTEATQLFNRRQRLRESAAMVAGILDS
ncbi:hypothetical protein BCV70DRAFT_200345 [Testicularia cyperi]|uniref:Uncharacterized protein n=1 Tax=Testicularia cyperi TaxID=1882483 RepID=A0A317XQM6_9BASI|nr:hypothetical protein BCV70DRAFT_200345 [Testicularia cyperi]